MAPVLKRPLYVSCRLRQLKTARKLLRDFNTAAKVELEQQVAAGQAAVQQLLQLRQDLDAAYACIRCETCSNCNSSSSTKCKQPVLPMLLDAACMPQGATCTLLRTATRSTSRHQRRLQPLALRQLLCKLFALCLGFLIGTYMCMALLSSPL